MNPISNVRHQLTHGSHTRAKNLSNKNCCYSLSKPHTPLNRLTREENDAAFYSNILSKINDTPINRHNDNFIAGSSKKDKDKSVKKTKHSHKKEKYLNFHQLIIRSQSKNSSSNASNIQVGQESQNNHTVDPPTKDDFKDKISKMREIIPKPYDLRDTNDKRYSYFNAQNLLMDKSEKSQIQINSIKEKKVSRSFILIPEQKLGNNKPFLQDFFNRKKSRSNHKSNNKKHNKSSNNHETRKETNKENHLNNNEDPKDKIIQNENRNNDENLEQKQGEKIEKKEEEKLSNETKGSPNKKKKRFLLCCIPVSSL